MNVSCVKTNLHSFAGVRDLNLFMGLTEVHIHTTDQTVAPLESQTLLVSSVLP